MKRGKPSFLPPGEHAPEIDDEDAHMDDRKKKVKPVPHDDNEDFKDLRDDLQKRKKVNNDNNKDNNNISSACRRPGQVPTIQLLQRPRRRQTRI